jgi:hypothetical protein
MTRAEKADHWQRIQGLDRLARPHLAAGLGVPEAYRLAVEEQDRQRELREKEKPLASEAVDD